MKKRILCIIVSIITVLAGIMSFVGCNSKDVKYTVIYETDGNGTIYGEAIQNLKTGEESSSVFATANEGYSFLKWSDENTQAVRSDIAEDSDLTYIAYFEKCKYYVHYRVFVGGGIIEGDTEQTVLFGENATTVTAIPFAGYRFVSWMDNDDTNPVRTDTKISSNIYAMAKFERTSYDEMTVTYLTNGKGVIEGQANQQVLISDNATTVKVIANDGYEFVKWSDGVTTAERQDLHVAENLTVTAEFRCLYATFELNFKFGTTDTGITNYTFFDNDFEAVKFLVPTREHFTFGGWYIGEEQVTDENGTMVIGKEILQHDEREIYAKWTASENYTYKILMVYVTELDATIPSIKGNGNFDVYYKMSDFDIEICKTITRQVSYYFNDMLDGLVTFEIDEYFTTVPVGSESIINGSAVSHIEANKIPEIYNSGIYKNYQSILTVFCMNDYEYEFRTASGAAREKYGTVYLESVYDENLINKDPLEDILNPNYWRWYSIIETFIHELAHTMEMQMYGAYDYHAIIGWAHNQLMYDHILMNKLYFLNLIEIDGEKVGIPIEFWKGEMNLISAD